MELICDVVRRTMVGCLIVDSWINDLKVMDLMSIFCTFGIRLDDLCERMGND